MTSHRDADNSIVEQLAYLREQFKWYDSRYAWSSAAAFAMAYFMISNGVSFVGIRVPTGVHAQYVVSALLGGFTFLATLFFTAMGMVPYYLWNRRDREKYGCTSFMWSANVAAYDTASDFADSLEHIDEAAVRRARAEEIWRLSKLVMSRERCLIWARVFVIFMGVCAMWFAIEVLSIKGSITVNPFHSGG